MEKSQQVLKLALELILVRHGETHYTDTYPDLTNNGEYQAQLAGRAIQGMINGYTAPVIFHTSPAARARGTMNLLQAEIGSTEPVSILQDLRPLDALDTNTAHQYWYDNPKINYFGDPIFSASTPFEPRHQVGKRWVEYWNTQCCRASCTENPLIVVAVTHYEIMAPIVRAFFADEEDREELNYAEIVRAQIAPINQNQLHVKILFREKTAEGYYNLRTMRFN